MDEAWGAHLPFHPDRPGWAMDAGADVCVTSIHKMGSGLEQGSVFHLGGDLVDPAVLASRADLLGTTSPSVLLYAGMDGWRRQMKLHGRALLGAALDRAAEVRAAIDAIDGLHVHGRADFRGPGLGHDFDPLPVVIDVSGSARAATAPLTGCANGTASTDAHLTDHRRISTQLTHADDASTTQPLLAALRALAAEAPTLGPGPEVAVPAPEQLHLEQVMLPRDAYFGPVEDVPVAEAAGRVTAEMLTPYPPGIPAALPGERLTAPLPHYLRTGIAAGMNLPDAVDTSLRTVRVVAE